MWVGVPAGWAGEAPHPAPHRQVFCVLKGEYEVTKRDGDGRQFGSSDVLLLEDTQGEGHSTQITSDHAGLIFAVVLADE